MLMRKSNLLLLPLCIIFLITACQKELSIELKDSVSTGSLKDDSAGKCLPKTVQGIYKVGTVLVADSNYIDVQVSVTAAGSYRVYSDTVNGFFFQAKGNFGATGLSTVRLSGNGTPKTAGINNFTITYDSTECIVAVTTIVQGGALGAQFTLSGSPAACMNFVLTGDYKAGILLTAANTVVINVNVTVAGTYNLTTTLINGMTFSGAGTINNLGQQTITLAASGTPGIAESTTVPVTTGSSSCSFIVVVSAAVATFDYFPRTAASNWSYEFDGNQNDSLFLRAKPGTANISGNVYTVFEAQENPATGLYDFGYYRRSGSNYHTYADMGKYFGLDNAFYLDYIFLKDDAAVNATWQSAPINGTATDSSGTYPVSVRIVFSIEKKDEPIIVGGISYPNTIVVVEKYQVLNGANWVDATAIIGYIKNYFARGVGLIKLDYYYEDGKTNPPVYYAQNIRRYHVF